LSPTKPPRPRAAPWKTAARPAARARAAPYDAAGPGELERRLTGRVPPRFHPVPPGPWV